MAPVLQHRTLAQQLSGAFVVFAAIVAAAFSITALTYGISWVWLTPEFERSRLAVRAEHAAFAAMLDQENGLRGYLMTRDARFMEAHVRGVAGLARANLDLATYAGAVRQLSAPLLAMRMAQERFGEDWAKSAANSDAAAAPSMAEGKALFDAYRSERLTFSEALEHYNEVLFRREQRVISIQLVVVLSAFMAVFLLSVHQHRALRDSIVSPVAGLLRHIARVRDGDLQATTDPGGPRELRQLGEGLNDMVGALTVARAVAAASEVALREHSARLCQILDASREFSESLNLKYVLASVRSTTAAVGGYQRVIVWLLDDERKQLIDSDETVVASESSLVSIQMGHGIAGRAAKSGRITLEVPGGQVRFSDSNNLSPVCGIAVPLIVGARVVGTLEARHAQPRVATKEVIDVLEMLAAHAATAIESARLHEVVEERSQIDVLTCLLNRRRLDEDLAAECSRCLRYGRPLAFVMLDVDHFKAFNDTYGHPKADTVLQEVADLILGCVRTTDTAYRYGGEEFCVLMRETTADDAMYFAERVRQRIEQRFSTGGITGITASFGVAGFSSEAPTPRGLLEAADTAMYESKHAGRNRVALSTNPRPAVPSDRARAATIVAKA